MSPGANRRPGTWGAVLLTLLTVTVFFLFQNYGPESAVRRFQEAVAAKDPREVTDICVTGASQPTIARLAGWIEQLQNDGAVTVIRGMDRQPTLVLIQTVSELHDGRGVAITWVVKKQTDGWKIDPEGTVNYWRHALGL